MNPNGSKPARVSTSGTARRPNRSVSSSPKHTALRRAIESVLSSKAWDSERQINVATAWSISRLASETDATPSAVLRVLNELVQEGSVATRTPRDGVVLYKRADSKHRQWQSSARHIAAR